MGGCVERCMKQIFHRQERRGDHMRVRVTYNMSVTMVLVKKDELSSHHHLIGIDSCCEIESSCE